MASRYQQRESNKSYLNDAVFLDINLHHVAISLFGETAWKKKAVGLLILINIR